jgi:hypothetical protein
MGTSKLDRRLIVAGESEDKQFPDALGARSAVMAFLWNANDQTQDQFFREVNAMSAVAASLIYIGDVIQECLSRKRESEG